MADEIINIPTNLIMGFLGVGKTTATLDLLKQKPKEEHWAVLVNEFGKVGIDGAIYTAAGATVKEVAGGCLCCAVAVPFQVAINQLLKQARPDRLLIEPTGLGHPKKVLGMLTNESFNKVLDVRANICLVDPEKLKHSRYTTHENFIDQIALSDVLVANKMDLADSEAIQLFYQWAEQSQPEKALIAQATEGQLDVSWLDIARNPERQAAYPSTHQINKIFPVDKELSALENIADGYQSFGYIFPEQSCFDFSLLNNLFRQLDAERIKGMFYTDRGWFIINSVDGNIELIASPAAENSRIEMIGLKNQAEDLSAELKQCLIKA